MTSNNNRPSVYINGKEMHLAMNPMPSCPLPGPESLGPLLNVSCEHGVWLPWARRICQAQAALSSVRYHLYPSPAASPRLQTTGPVWPSAHQRGSVWRGALPSWCRPSSELSGRISLLGCVAWILEIKDAPQIESSTFLKKLYFVLRYRQLTRRRQWHPTPVYLPGESQGWRSLVGCSPWGREESDTTERLHFHFSLSCIGEGNGNPLQCSCLENPRGGGAWWAAV